MSMAVFEEVGLHIHRRTRESRGLGYGVLANVPNCDTAEPDDICSLCLPLKRPDHLPAGVAAVVSRCDTTGGEP